MGETCRCCLKTNITLLEISIIGDEKFRSCTGLEEFTKTDGVSQCCCSFCYKKINEISLFQEECKKADLFLRKLLLKNDIKNELNTALDVEYDDGSLKIEKNEDNAVIKPIEEIFEMVHYTENENSEQIVDSTAYCDECKRTFTSAKNLNIHMTKFHKANKSNRSDCGLKLTEIKSFKCRFCRHVFQKHSLLLKHLRIQHFTNSGTVNHDDFNENDKTIKEESLHILDNLKSSEVSINRYKEFLSKHNETVPENVKKNNEEKLLPNYHKILQVSKYHCDLCGLKFARKQYLVTHFKIKHLKVMKFTCKLCWKGFVNYNVFHSHLVKIHLKQKLEPTADEMDKYLITNHDPEYSNFLWKDIKLPDQNELNEKDNYICKLCDKTLNTKTSLKAHFSNIHLKLTNISHKCNACRKIFRYKYLLIQHHRKFHHFRNTHFNGSTTIKKYIENGLTKNNKVENLIKNFGSSRYNCDYCDTTFRAKRYLKIHMKRKHPNIIIPPNEYKCSICNNIFNEKYLLRNHIKDNHSEEYAEQIRINFKLKMPSIRYDCNYCDNSFGVRRYLKAHMRRKHPNVTIPPQKFECSVCNDIFTKQYLLTNHMKDYHPEEYAQHYNCYNCDYCDNSFGEKRYLKAHMVRKHPNITIPPNEFKCSICNNIFNEKYLLRNHMKDNHPEKYSELIPVNCKFKSSSNRFDCNYCDNTFGAKRYLNGHMKRKHAEFIIPPNQFECSVCKNIFTKQYLFKNHMKDNHPEEYSELIRVNCKICNKSISAKSIHSHLKTHEDRPKNIQCAECGRTFFSQSTYYYHQKTHSNEKPFKCTFTNCSKAFLTNFQLVSHLNTHADVKKPKRYHCHYCGKGCSSTTEIKVHLRIHTKERPYKCSMCNKGFLTKTHLRNHSYSHTGEKNYKCKEDGCKSAYSSISSLKKHYCTVHYPEDQKIYQCDLCLKKFAQRTFLNQHRKAHGKIARVEKN